MSKRAYFSTITYDKGTYLVEVPDLEIFTESPTLEGAIEMGRNAIGEVALARIDMGLDVPEPTDDVSKVLAMSEYKAVGEQITTLIDIDIAKYQLMSDNRAVRRNVTLPNWLNVMAEESGINVSKLLQEALMSKLNVSK